MASIKVRGGFLSSSFICSKNEGTSKQVSVAPLIFLPVQKLLDNYGVPVRRAEPVLRRGVNRLLEHVGIQRHVMIHDLRRAAITNYLSLGVLPAHLIAKVFTGHALSSGGDKAFWGYGRSTMASSHRTIYNLLKMVPLDQTAGIRLV